MLSVNENQKDKNDNDIGRERCTVTKQQVGSFKRGSSAQTMQVRKVQEVSETKTLQGGITTFGSV